VQTINLPKASKPGSVGLPLPHAHLKLADDGEIFIAGATHLGYLGQLETAGRWLATGDLGWVDHDGFVYLRGRKKNVLITGYGRNVSPEWVEARLQEQAAIGVAVVLGDGQPVLGAVVWPTDPAVSDTRIQQAIDCANARLPDYARVGPWCRAMQAYSPEHGVCTANGRPVRAAISARYSDALFPVLGNDSVSLSLPETINPDLTEMS
jgi:long-chain acyl-CoA synthetase